MAHIAIVKVRGDHDLQWRPSRGFKTALRLLGAKDLLQRVEGTAGQSYMPQLALPFLAALGQRYNEVHGQSHRFTLVDDHEDNLRLEGFDLVWFTAYTAGAPAAYRVSDRLRARGIQTVIGGIHPSVLPDEAAAHATSVVIGEGEEVVAELLADLDAGRPLKPRYRGSKTTSLDGLPVPRWSDALTADYCAWVVPVQTSRGCRNACHFCSTTRFQGARRRHRPVAEVVAELRQLQDEGVLTDNKTVFFTDNNVVWDTDHRRGKRDSSYARQLFEALVPLKISWVGQGEVGVGADPDLVHLMARSGCCMLLIGLETLQQKNLDTVGKPCNRVDEYAKHIDTLHRHGIANIGCFMLGLDEDDEQTFEQTTEFVERYVDIPQLTLLTAFPGTALYRRFDKEGRILHRDWSRYDITHVTFRPKHMSPERLEELYVAMLNRLFTYPAMWHRALRYALTPTVDQLPGLSTFGRFTSVLAPNLIYRRLTQVGREPRATRWQPWRTDCAPSAVVG